MLMTMETCLRRAARQLERWGLEPGLRAGGRVLLYAGGGFLISAAGLHQVPQPLAMGLILAVAGWPSAVTAMGAALGYRLLWPGEWLRGLAWAVQGYLLGLLAGKGERMGQMPLLIPALAGTAAAVTELVFLGIRGTGSLFLFFLRTGAAFFGAWFFPCSLQRRQPVTDWLWAGVGTLALARVGPGWAGYLAAGTAGVWASFPAAALAGLGADLAGITRVPMAAAVCAAWLIRQLPFTRRWMGYAAPGVGWLIISVLWGIRDPAPLPGLVLGGVLGGLLPPRRENSRRRGQTGIAQVRLELTAGVMARFQQLLLEIRDPPVDQQALLQRARERVCGRCVSREHCREQQGLQLEHLMDPFSFTCRRPGDIHQELLCSRERLQNLKADRLRRQEYRGVLQQQYRFLSVYLQQLSDELPGVSPRPRSHYRLEVSARSRGREKANGDRCMAFPGIGVRYYILLCDGMGTGPGAAREGSDAGNLIRQMLTAGFSPEQALRSVNALLALGDRAGAVTLDLAEVRLDSGSVAVYKWGAAPSYVLRRSGTEKIGTATPPPGIRVTDVRETVVRLSLRRGEMLILVSDGVEAGECLRRKEVGPVLPPGELAQRLLEECAAEGEDDATVAVVRLSARRTSS